jgi:D-serine ammonia-lyase
MLVNLPSISIFGFYCHAGHSYRSTSAEDILRILALEIESVDEAASLALKLISESKLGNQHTSPFILSVGSTPTANVSGALPPLRAPLHGVLELHAGNYPLLDLQQRSTSLIGLDQISIRSLATVISYYPGRGPDGTDEALCDAGAMALSKDTGPSGGFGLAMQLGAGASLQREVAPDWKMVYLNQEHGVLRQIVPVPGESQSGEVIDGKLEVGSMLEIIPQHACLATAPHSWFYVVDSDSADGRENIVDIWVPWKGW